AKAIRSGLGLHPSDRYGRIREPYVFDLVRRELVKRYGRKTVRHGGLEGYTTIEPKLQQDAQAAVGARAGCYPGGGPASALAPVARRDRRAGLEPALLAREPVQLRRTGAPAAWLVVQDVRAGDRDQEGRRSRPHLLRRQLADDPQHPRRRRPVDGPQRRAGAR